jgi:Zn-dependent protease with chaperone function
MTTRLNEHNLLAKATPALARLLHQPALGRLVARMLAIHPSVEKRIKRLKQMAPRKGNHVTWKP